MMFKEMILKKKKGQIIGQVFVYILVAIVIGGIVLTGFWAFKTIREKSCQVEQINFQDKFVRLLQNSNSFMKISRESLTVPCSYERICLVDISMIGSSITCENKIVSASVLDKQRMNIFAIGTKGTFPIGYSEYLRLANPSSCLCLNSTNGRFYFELQGQGQDTLLKVINPS